MANSKTSVGIDNVATAPKTDDDMAIGKVSELARIKDTHAYTVGIKSTVLVNIPK